MKPFPLRDTTRNICFERQQATTTTMDYQFEAAPSTPAHRRQQSTMQFRRVKNVERISIVLK